MSNLLSEAIVDAKALRDAALKNAETIVIEKYSDQVKKTLDRLLEQPEMALDPAADLGVDPLAAPGAEMPMEDPAAMGVDPLAPEGDEGEPEEISEDDIPLAATDDFNKLDGKNLNKLPADGEEVALDINLDALQEAVSKLTDEIDEDLDINEEALADILSEDDEEVEVNLSEAVPMEDPAAEEGPVPPRRRDPPGATPPWEEDPESAELEEDFDVDSLVNAITEKLTVDMGADLTGWAGRSSSDMKYAIEKELAHRRSTDVQEDLENLKKAQEELVFENKQLAEQNNQYEQALEELKEALQDVNLSNARLLYTNRVLRNTSLNERQKTKIVEAISGAGSVTEAKMIFKTLQSTMETTPKRGGPQSLSEVIGRNRATVIRASRHETATSDPFTDRMKRLAGIK